MPEGTKRWKWWQKLGLGVALLLLATLPAVRIGSGKPKGSPATGVQPPAALRPAVEPARDPATVRWPPARVERSAPRPARLVLPKPTAPRQPTDSRPAELSLASRCALQAAAWFVCRSPWVEPLPGIRVEMARPPLRADDLGPESAYKLLLEAVEPPAGLWAPNIWRNGWHDAGIKFERQSWPAGPPPPAPEFSRDDPALAAEAPWTREQYEDILRLRKLHEPSLAILDYALLADSPQVPTPDSADYLVGYLANVRALARWLVVSARYRATEGDYAGSAQDIARTLGMAHIICRGSGEIGHLIAFACDAVATRAAWWVATREDVPVAVLRRMARSFLSQADTTEPFAEAVRAEWHGVLGTVPEIYRRGTFDIMDDAPANWRRPFAKLGFSLSFVVGSTPRATAANLRSGYQHLVAIAELPYSAATEAEYGRFLRGFRRPRRGFDRRALRWRDPVGYVLASELLPALAHCHRKAARHDATVRGTALFLAIQAYEKERGALPEQLAQLVPDYLPRVPKDPFDGKPFRYLRSGVPGLPPQAWAVYSIGENFTDNGGKAHSVGSPRHGRVVNPDLVWPSQAYPPPTLP